MRLERKEKIKSDKESGNFYSEILKSAPLGLHQYEFKNGKLIFSDFNREADRILGVSHQVFIGKELQEIFPPLAETEIPEAYIKVATTGTIFQSEQVNYQYQQIIGAYQVFAFQPEKNKVTIFFRDITEIKKAEKKLRDSGIQSDMFDLIFERFRQVNEGHTRTYGGTGLGLPISKGIIELMGGKIRVKSIYGEGTTFFFDLPYEEVKKKKRTDLKEKVVSMEYLWKNKLILVVEDDDLNFEFIKIVLKPTFARIIHVSDGEATLEICSRETFDIILLDIRLPKMNGFEVAGKLREQGCKTPIIAQTAYAMSEDRDKCIAAGCDDYMSKPLNKNVLLEKIDTLLSKEG